MAKKQTSKSSVKKKKWYKIVAPKIFGETVLGETSVVNPEDAFGKPLKLSLMNITNDIKKQNITISFIIDTLQGSNLTTKPIGYEMIPSAIKRLVRRRRNRLDESFMCYTQDKILIRIKPFMLTRTKTIGSNVYNLRMMMIEKVVAYVAAHPYERLIPLIVNHKLQNDIKNELNKAYPMKNFEIRKLFLVKPESKGRIEKVSEEKKSAVKSKKNALISEESSEAEESKNKYADTTETVKSEAKKSTKKTAVAANKA
jgi:small subunit ribosomal protein S3Ae